MFKQFISSANRVGLKQYSTRTTPNVWVVTDGGIENTLQAMSLGKQLAGSNQLSNTFKLKTVVASKKLHLFPAIIQKYLVNWSVSKQKGNTLNSLPWYLSTKDEFSDSSNPDYIITSGQDSIPACFHLTQGNTNKKIFSVYVGYPDIPFINFDQVVLPKYEANAKMAALGPFARQKNGIITPAPLLDTFSTSTSPLDQMIPASFKDGYSSVIIGGHSSICRWYSEDALNLADNIKRMVKNLNDKIVIVFTDRTPDLVKQKMTTSLQELDDSVFIWDSTKQASTIDKINTYESIIENANRVVLTADLDYACTHALSKSKPVYITFGGQARSYLSHLHRWLLDEHLTRKLRLERNKHKSSAAKDPYSYLGDHADWGNAIKVLQIKDTMAYVKKEIEEIREEKVTGKRRK
ncbi:mitochondrial fission ELM1-domain-containing protein [Thamnidium elegans]|nr:mitochondrial fission ELM1-domain-containing protein [Thamnidium elegans]